MRTRKRFTSPHVRASTKFGSTRREYSRRRGMNTHRTNSCLWMASMMLMVFVFVGIASAQQTPSTRQFFYVGGKYVGSAANQFMTGQMYVEVLRPQRVSQRYPLVFFHG